MMMKTLLIVALVLLTLFAVSQVWVSKASKDIEMYSYDILESYAEFEIRAYESANFAYVTMPEQTYKESSGQGFRMLAGYIFGGNETGQKIAMTSPVSMTMQDSITMMFMVPKAYTLDDLPVPNNTDVRFKQEPGKTMAAIRFGGWANDEKIAGYTEKLKALLEEQGIEHLDNFSYLGYNPPYEMMNRRNEVVVEVLY
jgi:hypothetical protein